MRYEAGDFRIHEPLGVLTVMHSHDAPHLTVILSGSARVMIDGKAHEINATDAEPWAYVPAHAAHSVGLSPGGRAICVFPRLDVLTQRVE
jgi:quercetin dioxygenase-like cupin family protein